MRCALLLCIQALFVASAVLPGISMAVSLNEVLPAPGSDWNGDFDSNSKTDEWIEIANGGTSSCDLSDWLLLTGDTGSVVYGFSGTIEAGAVEVVYGSDAVAWESENGHSAIGLSLNNSGDVIWLARVVSGDTVVVDSLRYASADVGYDVSIGRLPDAVGPWTLFDHFMPKGGEDLDPTPGAPNSSDPPPHILSVGRDPLYPTSGDSTHIVVDAGDASGITQVLLAYQINLEDGEEPEMELVSGACDLGTWKYTILPCAASDTVNYRISVYEPGGSTVSPRLGYRVRSNVVTMRINEILADPPAGLDGDANRDGERDAADDEFIEIVNCGDTTIDISGWYLSDAVSVRHIFPDTGFVLTPGEFVTVFGGGSPTGFQGKVFVASSGGLGLTNTGDNVVLSAEGGLLVDIHIYGTEGGRDESVMRYPDCGTDWMLPSDAGLDVPFTPNEPNGEMSSVTSSTWGGIKALYE